MDLLVDVQQREEAAGIHDILGAGVAGLLVVAEDESGHWLGRGCRIGDVEAGLDFFVVAEADCEDLDAELVGEFEKWR